MCKSFSHISLACDIVTVDCNWVDVLGTVHYCCTFQLMSMGLETQRLRLVIVVEHRCHQLRDPVHSSPSPGS